MNHPLCEKLTLCVENMVKDKKGLALFLELTEKEKLDAVRIIILLSGCTDGDAATSGAYWMLGYMYAKGYLTPDASPSPEPSSSEEISQLDA